MLRIHRLRFARRDVEEVRIEAEQIIDKAAAARITLAERIGVGIRESIDVPAVGRDFANPRSLGEDEVPQNLRGLSTLPGKRQPIPTTATLNTIFVNETVDCRSDRSNAFMTRSQPRTLKKVVPSPQVTDPHAVETAQNRSTLTFSCGVACGQHSAFFMSQYLGISPGLL